MRESLPSDHASQESGDSNSDSNGRAASKRNGRSRSTLMQSKSSKSIGPKSSDLGTSPILERCRKSTLSAADSLAKTSPRPILMPPESPEVVQDSGGNYFERFAWYDPSSRLWRTYQCSLIGEWEPFSETWPKAGMTRNGVAYRLTLSAANTEDCGCFLLPTPQASDGLRLRFSLENLKNADRNQREKGSHLGSYLAETLAAEFGLSQTPELSEYLMGFPIGFTEIANGNGAFMDLETPSTRDDQKGSAK